MGPTLVGEVVTIFLDTLYSKCRLRRQNPCLTTWIPPILNNVTLGGEEEPSTLVTALNMQPKSHFDPLKQSGGNDCLPSNLWSALGDYPQTLIDQYTPLNI